MESARVRPFSACSSAWSITCNVFTIPFFVHALYYGVSVYCSNDEITIMRIWKCFRITLLDITNSKGMWFCFAFTSCGVSETSHQLPPTKTRSCEWWESRCLVPSRCYPGEKTLYLDPCCCLWSWDTDTDACVSSVKGETRTWVTCKDLQIREESHRRTCCNIHNVWIEGILLFIWELVPEENGRNAVGHH